MAAKQCPTCRATADQNGETSCDCAVRAAHQAAAAFQSRTRRPFSARPVFVARAAETSPQPHTESTRQPAPVSDDLGTAGNGRRRKGTIAAAAVAVLGLATILFATGIMGDGRQPTDDSARPEPIFSASPLTPLPPDEAPPSPSAGLPTGSAGNSAAASVSASGGGTDGAPPDKAGDGRNDSTAGAPAQNGGGTSAGSTSGSSVPTSSNGGQQQPPVLKQGDRGPEVAKVQRLLNDRPQDGIYDEKLARKVKNFQRKHGINDDPPGVYGPSTRQALEGDTS